MVWHYCFILLLLVLLVPFNFEGVHLSLVSVSINKENEFLAVLKIILVE